MTILLSTAAILGLVSALRVRVYVGMYVILFSYRYLMYALRPFNSLTVQAVLNHLIISSPPEKRRQKQVSQ